MKSRLRHVHDKPCCILGKIGGDQRPPSHPQNPGYDVSSVLVIITGRGRRIAHPFIPPISRFRKLPPYETRLHFLPLSCHCCGERERDLSGPGRGKDNYYRQSHDSEKRSEGSASTPLRTHTPTSQAYCPSTSTTSRPTTSALHDLQPRGASSLLPYPPPSPVRLAAVVCFELTLSGMRPAALTGVLVQSRLTDPSTDSCDRSARPLYPTVAE